MDGLQRNGARHRAGHRPADPSGATTRRSIDGAASTLPGRGSKHTAQGSGDTLLVYHRRAEEYREPVRRRCPDLAVLAVTDETTLYDTIAGADILITWRFPLQALAGSSRLRWIQLTVASVDHLIAARKWLPGIAVTTARGIHGAVIADYLLGVVVMLHWDFPRLLRHQPARQWQARETAPLDRRAIRMPFVGPRPGWSTGCPVCAGPVTPTAEQVGGGSPGPAPGRARGPGRRGSGRPRRHEQDRDDHGRR